MFKLSIYRGPRVTAKKVLVYISKEAIRPFSLSPLNIHFLNVKIIYLRVQVQCI